MNVRRVLVLLIVLVVVGWIWFLLFNTASTATIGPTAMIDRGQQRRTSDGGHTPPAAADGVETAAAVVVAEAVARAGDYRARSEQAVLEDRHRQRDGMPVIAACTSFRNEAPVLLEWIAHHFSVGVTKFFLFDDGSSDGPLDVLGELIESGLVELWQVPDRVKLPFDKRIIVNPQQGWSYEKCARVLAPARGVDWLLLTDTDEFLVVDDDVDRDRLTPWLPRVLNREPWTNGSAVGGIHLSSFAFSARGHVHTPDTPITASYLWRQRMDGLPKDCKCLLKVGHDFALHNHVCDVWPPPRNARGQPSTENGLGGVQKGPPVLTPLALFHYRSKSIEQCAFKVLNLNYGN